MFSVVAPVPKGISIPGYAGGATLEFSSVEELSFVEELSVVEAIIEKRAVAGSFRTFAGPFETLAGTMKADAEQASARVRVMRDM